MMQQLQMLPAEGTISDAFTRPYRIANKYSPKQKYFELWDIHFISVMDAETYIKWNYPQERYPNMEWVIVRASC